MKTHGPLGTSPMRSFLAYNPHYSYARGDALGLLRECHVTIRYSDVSYYANKLP